MCVCVCFGRCGLPSVPAGLGGGEAVQRGVTAERGEEHPEERRQPAAGSAAAAAGPDARGQTAKVSADTSVASRSFFIYWCRVDMSISHCVCVLKV